MPKQPNTKLHTLLKTLIKEVLATELEEADAPELEGSLCLHEGDYEVTAEDVAKYPEAIRKHLTTIPQPLAWRGVPEPHDPYNLTPSIARAEAARENYLQQLMKAANTALGQPLGRGSSRAVYSVSPTRVLKLAMNTKGLAQNKAEVDAYEAAGRDPDAIVAQIFEYDSRYRWLESEKAVSEGENGGPQLDKAFMNATGMDFWDFVDYGFYGEEALTPTGKTFNKKLRELMRAVSLEGNDLTRGSAWGVVKRGGKLMPILVDYGFTTDVMEKYY